MPQQKQLLIGAALVFALIAGWFAWNNRETTMPTVVIETNQTLPGGTVVEDGTRVVVKNGATITVDGDYTVKGLLECENGALNLVVKGAFKVERLLRCERGEQRAATDVG
ncbi:MAG TPA: hypothetical protein VN397_04205, partial [Candidatus Methylomirabilis sp.]|nr:hypothetical protein [Candidatus Methylomirabilis sp.]